MSSNRNEEYLISQIVNLDEIETKSNQKNIMFIFICRKS